MSEKNNSFKFKTLLWDIPLVAIGAAGVFIGTAYPFFKLMTYAGKKEEKVPKSNRKKWFELKHTKINHPKYKHEKEYLATREWCESQKMQDWSIRSMDGLNLHAAYLPADNPKRLVLFSHGYRGTSFGSIAHMAQHLHDNGSSLLFVDQRCCGKSEGEYITFGAKEQYDILWWIQRLNEENVDHLPIYLFGQSMGTAAVLLASGHELPKEVKGIIADCGFHSMKQQLRDMASEWFHLHWIELLLIRVDLFCRIFAGFKMKDADTTDALKHNKLPILFIHGEEDTYVLPENTVMNYSLCSAPKELVLVPEARHLCSSYEAPELYKKKLDSFFEKYD